jgi:hypothetical protein
MGWPEPAEGETDVMGGQARGRTEVMGRPQPAGERTDVMGGPAPAGRETDVMGGPGRPTDVMSGRVTR